jgi:hypothetical protein
MHGATHIKIDDKLLGPFSLPFQFLILNNV